MNSKLFLALVSERNVRGSIFGMEQKRAYILCWSFECSLGLVQIATPARYTVTLGGTSLSVKYLRQYGYLSTPPPVKEYLQEKMEETKERLSEKMEETKDRFSEKMEETKDRLSERMEETKGKFSERLQETKDKVSFRKKID